MDQRRTDVCVVRLQQQSEFICVAKAFVYLAAQLSGDELLEPVTTEDLEPVVRTVKNMVAMIAADPQSQCFLSGDADVNSIEAACGCGRPSSTAAEAAASLHEAEPDMFPCLVVICGSAFAFLKVSTDKFCFRYRLELEFVCCLPTVTVLACIFRCFGAEKR